MKRIYAYAANLEDAMIVRNLSWKTNIDYELDEVIEIVEKADSRVGFEKLLQVVNKGDIVIISSVGALDDGSDFSIMRNLRGLEGRGVKLRVEMEPDFSYASYEAWYKKKNEIDEARIFFKEACTPKEYWYYK